MGDPRDPDAQGLDALRRRLYRPGSTESDVLRYLAERSDVAPDAPPETVPALPRARIRRLLPAAALTATAAAAVAVALVVPPGRPPAPRPSALGSATSSPAPVLVQDIGDGDTLTVPRRASSTGVPAAVAVDGAAVVGQRFAGSGNALLVIDPPRGSTRGGVATVAVTAAGPVPVAWRALAPVYRGRWIPVSAVLARGSSTGPAGAIAPRSFRYAAAPPSRVAVIAPAGVRWSVVVGVAPPGQALH
ncbi:hypothetical protein [Amnibacterium kyonggiense]